MHLFISVRVWGSDRIVFWDVLGSFLAVLVLTADSSGQCFLSWRFPVFVYCCYSHTAHGGVKPYRTVWGAKTQHISKCSHAGGGSTIYSKSTWSLLHKGFLLTEVQVKVFWVTESTQRMLRSNQLWVTWIRRNLYFLVSLRKSLTQLAFETN